ncbi:MAG: hypothetical protein LBB30_01665 [Candidatus Methanoplasma sp.]|nr:hypothetical protein [Candidatus Methanoplasma sp.]
MLGENRPLFSKKGCKILPAEWPNNKNILEIHIKNIGGKAACVHQINVDIGDTFETHPDYVKGSSFTVPPGAGTKAAEVRFVMLPSNDKHSEEASCYIHIGYKNLEHEGDPDNLGYVEDIDCCNAYREARAKLIAQRNSIPPYKYWYRTGNPAKGRTRPVKTGKVNDRGKTQ